MGCVQCDRFDVVSVATPVVTATGVPSGVVPSENCTVPVADAGVTRAVKVTAWPAVDGFAEEVSATLEIALLITCETAFDGSAEWLASPAYEAVMACVPTGTVSVVQVATPALKVAGVALSAVASANGVMLAG